MPEHHCHEDHRHGNVQRDKSFVHPPSKPGERVHAEESQGYESSNAFGEKLRVSENITATHFIHIPVPYM